MHRQNGSEKRGLFYAAFLSILLLFIRILVCIPLQAAFGTIGIAAAESLILLCAWLGVWILHLPARKVFALQLPSRRSLIGSLLIGISATFFLTVLSGLIIKLFPLVDHPATELSALIGSPSFLTLILYTLLTPICEEFFFRGLLLYTAHIQPSPLPAVLFSAIFFGIYHLDPLRFLPTALLGILWGALTLYTNSLIIAILLHAWNNFVALGPLYFPQCFPALSLQTMLPLVMFSLAMLCFLSRMILPQYQKRKVLSKCRALVVAGILLSIIGGILLFFPIFSLE